MWAFYSKLHFSCESAYFHAWWAPEGCGQHRVGRLDHLSLWCDTWEVALVEGGVQPSFKRRVHVGKSHEVLGFLWGWKNRAVRLRIWNRQSGKSVKLDQTCRILSCAAGVLGVRRAMELLVTLYSDRRALEAELVIPDSSAVCRAISLAWPSLTTSSSSASEIWNENQ